MAFYTKLEGPALDAWRATQRILVARAMKELKLGRDEIVVRDLIPQDLGLSTIWDLARPCLPSTFRARDGTP